MVSDENEMYLSTPQSLQRPSSFVTESQSQLKQQNTESLEYSPPKCEKQQCSYSTTMSIDISYTPGSNTNYNNSSTFSAPLNNTSSGQVITKETVKYDDKYHNALGVLGKLSSQCLLKIVSFFDAVDLIRANRVSWPFFVLTNNESNWKYLTLLDHIDRSDRRKESKRKGILGAHSEYKVATFSFKGSWKLTYLMPERMKATTTSSEDKSINQFPSDCHVINIDDDEYLKYKVPVKTTVSPLLSWRYHNLRRAQALQSKDCPYGLHADWLKSSPASINFLTLRGDLMHPPQYALGSLSKPTKTYQLYNIIGLDLRNAFPFSPNINDGVSIERRSAASLSCEEFRERYEKPNIPLVITGLIDHWPAMERWKLDTFIEKYRDVPLKCNGRCSKGRRFRLRAFDFMCYSDGWNGEKPLYVFDKKLITDVCPEITNDYTVPEYFTPKNDMFELMSEDDRPDYKWLLLGPNGSGSPFHQDPHGTSAWNAVIEGMKRVSFYPPDYIPPGIDEDQIDSDYYAGDDTMEWYRVRMPQILSKGKDNDISSFERDSAAWRACKTLKEKKRVSSTHNRPPIEVTVSRGEVLFIPSGWWHQVQNIGHTIGVTQNYCNDITFPRVVRDLNASGGSAIRKDFREALERSSKYRHLAQQINIGKRQNRGRSSSCSSSSDDSSSCDSDSSCSSSSSSSYSSPSSSE